MSLTGDTFDFQQGNVVTSSAQLVDNAATVGDVLTVQTDKSIAAAPGGGSQTLTLLGPFHVNYNTPNIGAGPVTLASLADGLMIIEAPMIVTTAWDDSSVNPNALEFFVSVLLPDSSATPNITVYEGASAADVDAEPVITAYPQTAARRIVRTQAGSSLTFEAYPGTGPFTAGGCDVYALAYTL